MYKGSYPLYDFDFPNNIGIHPDYIPHSASKRRETVDYIEKNYGIYNKKFIRVIIDGSKFTSDILNIDDDTINSNDLPEGTNKGGNNILLPGGIDGITSTVRKNFELVLPIADCGGIIVQSSSGISGLYHAGYKGVSGNVNEDLGIIINLIDSLRSLYNSDDLSEFGFFLSPMAGKNFELNTDYIMELFNEIFNEFNLDYRNYVIKNPNKKGHSFLNLKLLIKDLLIKYGNLKEEQLKGFKSKAKLETNNPKSIFPSYRLSTKVKKIRKLMNKKEYIDNFKLGNFDEKKLREEFPDLDDQDIDLIISGEAYRYVEDRRMAVSVSNYSNARYFYEYFGKNKVLDFKKNYF